MNKLLIEKISFESLKKIFYENDMRELDIFVEVNDLKFILESIWVDSISYEDIVYVCRIDIFYLDMSKIAYYKSVFDINYNVIDDFFVVLSN